MSSTARPLDQIQTGIALPRWQYTLSNALIITRREVRDSFRDWRILAPILILTFLFPSLAQFVAGRFVSWVSSFGDQTSIISHRTIPFMLMIVGFFPISISLVIALETFVGEKERRSLEPLLSTPLTNTELYIGKTLAAMIPPLVSSYGGMLVYLAGLVFGDIAWRPQPLLIIQIILLTTVQALVMVTGAVVVSSQTTSTRAANLLASFIIIPMTLIIQGESAIMFLAPDADSSSGIGALWAIIIGMAVVIVLLLRVGNSVFNREELLGSTIDQFNLKLIARRIWVSFRAVDEAGTPARSLVEWYRRGITMTLRRLRREIAISFIVFIAAVLGGVYMGNTPEWRIPQLRNLDEGQVGQNMASISDALDLYSHEAVRAVIWQNGRVIIGATLLSVFTFGVAALVIMPLAFFILGFLYSQVTAAGLSAAFMIPAVLTHGIVEIPVALVATAAALRLGAVMTHPPKGQTVSFAWSQAFGDALKLGIGLVLPGLVVGALLEVYATPVVVRLFLGT